MLHPNAAGRVAAVEQGAWPATARPLDKRWRSGRRSGRLRPTSPDRRAKRRRCAGPTSKSAAVRMHWPSRKPNTADQRTSPVRSPIHSQLFVVLIQII